MYLLIFGGNDKKKRCIQLRILLTRFTFLQTNTHTHVHICTISGWTINDSIGFQHCIVLQNGFRWKFIAVGYGLCLNMIWFGCATTFKVLDMHTSTHTKIDSVFKMCFGCQIELKLMHKNNNLIKKEHLFVDPWVILSAILCVLLEYTRIFRCNFYIWKTFPHHNHNDNSMTFKSFS